MAPEPRQDLSAPVHLLERDVRQAESVRDGIALCLSGGGYRAMLFHVGSLWRLNELGYLPRLNRVSSVSGGSITAGVLAMNWKALIFNGGVGKDFVAQVVDPIRLFASVTVDQWAIGVGVITPGVSVSDRVVASYNKYLFKKKTLQDLPDEASGTPRFIFNATNVQSGALWRFSKAYMADYRVGRVNASTTELALAVAASSAFPPVLSPAHLGLEPGACVAQPGCDLNQPPYTTEVVLTDGGVYDNLGLETAWKAYKTVLVSDGGGKMQADPHPPANWVSHSERILDLIDNQVRSLRKRQLIDSYKLPAADKNHRTGTYWGIRTDVADYGFSGPAGYPFTPAALPHDKTLRLASVATRLKALDDRTQEQLINWGYAVCDVAIRTHVDKAAPLPAAFPYPVGVG